MRANTSKRRPLTEIGNAYGRLVVRSYLGANRHGDSVWLCECRCGAIKPIASTPMRRGETVSCGCRKREHLIAEATTHGLLAGGRHVRLHRAWQHMRARCNNPNHPQWTRYGGRGIRVCKRWDDYAAFAADMGEPPAGMSIDRIDNDGPYSPENCRWATQSEQMSNTSRTRFLTFNGKTQCVAAWARELAINDLTLRNRLRMGWSVERALTPRSVETLVR